MLRDLSGTLAAHPFFEGFEPAQVEFLVGCSANRSYRPGEFLFKEGETANAFFLVREGKVAVETVSPPTGPLTLATVGRGDVLGWSWIVPPYVHRSDARAIERTRVLAIDAVCLRDKLESDHELGFRLLTRFVGVMAQRLESSRMQLLDLYSNHGD